MTCGFACCGFFVCEFTFLNYYRRAKYWRGSLQVTLLLFIVLTLKKCYYKKNVLFELFYTKQKIRLLWNLLSTWVYFLVVANRLTFLARHGLRFITFFGRIRNIMCFPLVTASDILSNFLVIQLLLFDFHECSFQYFRLTGNLSKLL